MSNSILSTQARVHLWLDDVKQRIRRSELGLGAVEYAGIILVALVVVGLVAGALSDYDFKTKLQNKLNERFGA